MWPVVIRGLPLGTTHVSLRKCISSALEHLDERCELSSSPKVCNDEALVYLPTQDIQMALVSERVHVQCGDIRVVVETMDKEAAMQWSQPKQKVIPRKNRKPQHKLQRELNHSPKAPHTKEAIRSPPPVYNAEAAEELHVRSPSPVFNAEPFAPPEASLPTSLIWYQYFNNKHWITFSEDVCWRIEECYMQKKEMQFIWDDMLMDLERMTIGEHELKRTRTLSGRIFSVGRVYSCIEFELSPGDTMILMYEENTGYEGQQVEFQVLWNKNDEDDTYIHDVKQMIEPGQKNVNCDMLAFNVRAVDVKDVKDDKRDVISSAAAAAPSFANEFKAQCVEAVVVSLKKEESYAHGCIVCFPYLDKPQQHLAVLYDSRLAESKDKISVNMAVRCCIGTNPVFDRCSGTAGNQQFQYQYVAVDVVVSETKDCHPLFGKEILRKHLGRIMVAPTPAASPIGDGFIYNEKENNMCTIVGGALCSKFKPGTIVRYNEKQRCDLRYVRTDYVAKDVICVNKANMKYNNGSYYFLNQKIKTDVKKFKYMHAETMDGATDYQFIVEQAEQMCIINGCSLLFGVNENGFIVGQIMNEVKRNYVKKEIENRVGLICKFKPIIDTDGYVLVDNNIVIISRKVEDKEYKVGNEELHLEQKVDHQLSLEQKVDHQETKSTPGYFTPREGSFDIGRQIEIKINSLFQKEIFISQEDLETIIELNKSSLTTAKKIALDMLAEIETKSFAVKKKREEKMLNQVLSSPTTQSLQRQSAVPSYNILSLEPQKVATTTASFTQSLPNNKPSAIATSASVAQSIPLCSSGRHPKSVFLEWAQKFGKAAPKATFSDFLNVGMNTRIWSCQISYEGTEFKHSGSKKKDAETKCYQELVFYIKNKYANI